MQAAHSIVDDSFSAAISLTTLNRRPMLDTNSIVDDSFGAAISLTTSLIFETAIAYLLSVTLFLKVAVFTRDVVLHVVAVFMQHSITRANDEEIIALPDPIPVNV